VKDKATAKRLNDLAREEMKLRLLQDIRFDLEVCRLEGWPYREYLLELKEIIDGFVEEKKAG